MKMDKQILGKYETSRPKVGRRSSSFPPQRFIAEHFPDNIPQVETSKNKTRRDCIVCSSKNIRQKTFCMCIDCNVPLCVTPCFKQYHCNLHYDMIKCYKNYLNSVINFDKNSLDCDNFK